MNLQRFHHRHNHTLAQYLWAESRAARSLLLYSVPSFFCVCVPAAVRLYSIYIFSGEKKKRNGGGFCVSQRMMMKMMMMMMMERECELCAAQQRRDSNSNAVIHSWLESLISVYCFRFESMEGGLCKTTNNSVQGLFPSSSSKSLFLNYWLLLPPQLLYV